jgi:hypothetical protein
VAFDWQLYIHWEGKHLTEKQHVLQIYKFTNRHISAVLFRQINTLNAELNPICHLLILLGVLTFMSKCIVSISNKMQCYTVYIWKLLYMFRVVLPPIIRSAYNCIYRIWYLSYRYCYLPLSWKSWNRFECAVVNQGRRMEITIFINWRDEEISAVQFWVRVMIPVALSLLFNVHVSVHRNNIYIYISRCNITQFILSGNCSTCFRWYHHPSSGAQTTVSTASGICHTVTVICRYCGRVGTGLSVLSLLPSAIADDSRDSTIHNFHL